MSTLKFEVGKAYQTRDGRKAVCLTTTLGEMHPIGLQVGKNFIETTKKGHFYGDTLKSQNDIISEWIDKPDIDWSLMPAWAKFVAMDKEGNWDWYTSAPNTGLYMAGKIPAEYAPKWEGEWRKSLIERP
jgi:hypothetical protein